MKNSILLFLLGIFVTISFAMTTNQAQIITIKPAIPKVTTVQAFHAMYNIQDEIAEYVLTKAKQGYITKSISISEYEEWQRGVVVMEKY